jgi:hypothetical protein
MGMLENCLTMQVCRRPRLHKYGRGRPYADNETAHYFNIPAHKLLLRLFSEAPGRWLVSNFN